MYLLFGRSRSLGKIVQFAEENPEVGEIQRYVAGAYEVYKDYQKAGDAYVRAAEIATGTDLGLNELGMAAKAYYRAGAKAESDKIIVRMRKLVFEIERGEEILIRVLIELANLDSDMEIYYGLSERLLELKPDDCDTRFNLAYKYSQEKEERLALYHYLTIPKSERDTAAWNNLGVQYDHFDMVNRSINAYRMAEQMGETLAMSNIANKFIQSGFLNEAEEICLKATIIKDYHKNINYSIARIKEIPDEESKKEENLIMSALSCSEFYRAYGRGFCKNSIPECSGHWRGPKCDLVFETYGTNFHAEGIYEPPLSITDKLGDYTGLGGWPLNAKRRKRIIRYNGNIVGYSIKARYVDDEMADESQDISRVGSMLSYLMSKNEGTVLMSINDSCDEILVYDKVAAESDRVYKLIKLRS